MKRLTFSPVTPTESVLAERRWPAGTTLPFAVALDTLLEFAASAACISKPVSAVEVRVIATDEEVMIARHTQTTLNDQAAT